MIAASDVKRRGVSLFDEILSKFSEVVITVRGQKKYVVMDIARYEELRAKELDLAYREVMADVEGGRVHSDVAKHLEMIANA